MGKSVTAALFHSLNVPVFDSDACVHALLAHEAVPFIRDIFPSVWNHTTQSIDRGALGRIVFADKTAKDHLEKILHPMIWAKQQEFIAAHRRSHHPFIVLDIPLLFETGRDRICDMTICVTAPAFLQRRRVMAREGMTHEKFNAIMATQMPDHEKRQRANFVVQTGLGKAYTLQKLKKILGSTHES